MRNPSGQSADRFQLPSLPQLRLELLASGDVGHYANETRHLSRFAG